MSYQITSLAVISHRCDLSLISYPHTQQSEVFMNEKALFSLGKVLITRGALATLNRVGILPWQLLLMHRAGDWGDIHPEDAESNREALAEGMRLLSSYEFAPSGKIWVITEWDRSVTTLLLPEEY